MKYFMVIFADALGFRIRRFAKTSSVDLQSLLLDKRSTDQIENGQVKPVTLQSNSTVNKSFFHLTAVY